MAEDLPTLTSTLCRLLTELAEVEVAEFQARLQGIAHSPEQSQSARDRDGDLNAAPFRAERIRLAARVEIARLERETALVLMGQSVGAR